MRVGSAERLSAAAPANGREMDAMRRQAWQAQGVVMVRPDEISDKALRAAVTAWAEQTFGRRR